MPSPLSSPASVGKVATFAKKIFITAFSLYCGYRLARYLWSYVSPPQAPDNHPPHTHPVIRRVPLPGPSGPGPTKPARKAAPSIHQPTPTPTPVARGPITGEALALEKQVVSQTPAVALKELLAIYDTLATPECKPASFHYACLLYLHINECGTTHEKNALNGLYPVDLEGKRDVVRGKIYRVNAQLSQCCAARNQAISSFYPNLSSDYASLLAENRNRYEVAVVEKYFQDMGLTLRRDSLQRTIVIPLRASFLLEGIENPFEINFEKELRALNLPFEKRGNDLIPLQKKDGVSSPSISPLCKHVKETNKKLKEIQAGLERYRDPQPKLPLDENGEASLPIREWYLKDISLKYPRMTGKMYVDPLTNFVADPNTGQFKDCNAKKDVTEETLKWHLTISPTSLTTYRLSMPLKDMTIKKLYSMFMLLEAAETSLPPESKKNWSEKRAPLLPESTGSQLDIDILGSFVNHQGILGISHKEMELVHTTLDKREKLAEKFQEILEAMFPNDPFEITGGLKPLSDFLQKDPERHENKKFVKKHGISTRIAGYIELEAGCLMLPSAIQVQTYSTTMMNFLETLFSNLGMKAANGQPKTFLTDTRSVGLWHASNIGMDQVETLNIALEMILAMLKKKRQEESDFQFENYDDFIKMYATHEKERINTFFNTLHQPLSRLIADKLKLLEDATSLEGIQELKREALQLFFKEHLACSSSVWKNPEREEVTPPEMDRVLLLPLPTAQNNWERDLDKALRGRKVPPQVSVMKQLFRYFERSPIYQRLQSVSQQDFDISYAALKKAASTNAINLQVVAPDALLARHYGASPFDEFILHFKHSLYKLHLMSKSLEEATKEDKPQLEIKYTAALEKVLAIFIKNKDKNSEGKTGWEMCSNGFAADFQLIHDAISSDGTDPTLAGKLEFFDTLWNAILGNASWRGGSFDESPGELRILMQALKNSASKDIGLGMEANAAIQVMPAQTVPKEQVAAIVAFIQQNFTSYEVFVGFYDQLLSELLVKEKSQEDPTSLLLAPAFAGLTTEETLDALFFDAVEQKWDYLGLKEWLPLEMTSWLLRNKTLMMKTASPSSSLPASLSRLIQSLKPETLESLIKAQKEGTPFRQRSLALSRQPATNRNASPWACLFPILKQAPAAEVRPAAAAAPTRTRREPYYPEGAAAAAAAPAPLQRQPAAAASARTLTLPPTASSSGAAAARVAAATPAPVSRLDRLRDQLQQMQAEESDVAHPIYLRQGFFDDMSRLKAEIKRLEQEDPSS
jgi:hypothetical protein